MRRVITHARERFTSKNIVSPSNHGSSFTCSTARRLALSSAYRRIKPIRVSCDGNGGAPTSIPNIVRNHKSSLTH